MTVYQSDLDIYKMKRFTSAKKHKQRSSVVKDEVTTWTSSTASTEGQGDGGYDYLFVTPPPSEFICPHCRKVICEPYQATCCGQMYCYSCLVKLKSCWDKKMAATTTNCLSCSSPISMGNCFPDVSANSKINNLSIYCTNKTNGCEWTGPMNSIQSHIDECLCVPVACPVHIMDGNDQCTNSLCSNDHCSIIVNRCDLQDHMKSHCKWRMMNCRYCGREGQAVFIQGDEHQQLCPTIEIECKNEGCSVRTVRSAMATHLAVCSKEPIPCSYNGVGCREHFLRENKTKHEEERVRDHLEMTSNHLGKVVFHLTHTEAQLKALKGGVETSGVVKLVTTMMNGAESVNACFYTCRGGHKLCLNVVYYDSNNPSCQLGNGHLEIRVALMKGRYDDVIKWPFKGRLRVQLLNQEVDIDSKVVTKEVRFQGSLVGKDRDLQWITLGEMCGPFDTFVIYEDGYHTMYFDIMMLT